MAPTHSAPCCVVASESRTTSKYSTKFSLACTGALVAMAPTTRCGYLMRNQADRLPNEEVMRGRGDGGGGGVMGEGRVMGEG